MTAKYGYFLEPCMVIVPDDRDVPDAIPVAGGNMDSRAACIRAARHQLIMHFPRYQSAVIHRKEEGSERTQVAEITYDGNVVAVMEVVEWAAYQQEMAGVTPKAVASGEYEE